MDLKCGGISFGLDMYLYEFLEGFLLVKMMGNSRRDAHTHDKSYSKMEDFHNLLVRSIQRFYLGWL